SLRAAGEAVRQRLGEAVARAAQPELREPALLVAAIAGAPGVAEEALRSLGDPRLARSATRALELLGPAALGPIVDALRQPEALGLDDEASTALIDTACALAESAAPEQREALRGFLASRLSGPSDALREAALGGLGRLGTGNDLPLVAVFI